MVYGSSSPKPLCSLRQRCGFSGGTASNMPPMAAPNRTILRSHDHPVLIGMIRSTAVPDITSHNHDGPAGIVAFTAAAFSSTEPSKSSAVRSERCLSGLQSRDYPIDGCTENLRRAVRLVGVIERPEYGNAKDAMGLRHCDMSIIGDARAERSHRDAN